MKIKKIMLFTYDFPHKKTQDFIYRLLSEGYEIKYVISAPWTDLRIAKPTVRTSPVHAGLVHPRVICKAFNIKYIVTDHNSTLAMKYLKKHKVDLYVIAGARILSKKVIETTDYKILNIHPGILPKIRGLDTLLWSIYYNEPIGISAHLISEKIDLGKLVMRKKLKLNKDDTIIDISLRLLEEQSDVLISAIEKLKQKTQRELKDINLNPVNYNTKMQGNLEQKMIKKFNLWLKHQLEKK